MSDDSTEDIGLQDQKVEDSNNTAAAAAAAPANNPAASQKEKEAEAGKRPPKKDGYKSRCQRVIRTRPHLFLIFIISIMGFCYHFHLALNQYWDYKTTVSFSNEDPPDYKFQYPSATLCFQDVAPYYKLVETFPEYKEAVEKVRAEMKNRNDSLFWNKPETKNFINIGGLKLEGTQVDCLTGCLISLLSIHLGLHLHKYFEEKIFRNQSVLEILEKYSHTHHEECLLDSKPATKYGYKVHNCENVTKPVETINGEFRCFTYFLQLDLKDENNTRENDDIFMTSIFISSKTFERRTNKV